MAEFPRTLVGGVSLPRLIIGSNWFMGFSHLTAAKDTFIREYQSRANIAAILAEFLKSGVDAVMGLPNDLMDAAIKEAEDRAGRKLIRILTPHFNIVPGGLPENEPETVFDRCAKMNGTFCMPHQCVTDALMDKMHGKIRDIDKYTKMIRDRDMVPGLSSHMPEAVTITDKTNADIETYIQMYNSLGFLMQVEVDWIMRIITNAKKPVMTIKPLAAGRLQPVVGLAYVWNTIREQDMVTIGTTTVDEAKEVVELSLDFISRRLPKNQLQKTRSKKSLE